MKMKFERVAALLPLLLLAEIQMVVAKDHLKTSFAEQFVVPLRFHLLQAKGQPLIQTTLTRPDIERILKKVNDIWAQAGIRFSTESIVEEEAVTQKLAHVLEDRAENRRLLSLRPEKTRGSQVFNIYYVKTMKPNGTYLGEAIFVKDTASLREAPGGIDEPLPRVTAHELGHAFGLSHRQNTTNLMASGTTGTWLNQQEIQRARETAKKLEWAKREKRGK